MSNPSVATELDPVQEHGWTAVPRSLSKLLAGRDASAAAASPKALRADEIEMPSSTLVDAVTGYAKRELGAPTFHHSMRVFLFGQAIASQHFPAWRCSAETFLLACLLHDIGTTPANLGSTRLSFEFRGGMLALDLLAREGAPRPQVESVAETIIRHQDVGEEGNVSMLTALIHFGTLLDNVGANAELVHEDTIKSVTDRYPRLGWTSCFASVVRKEVELKPWSHTTKIEGFAEKVEANELMKPYD